MKRDAVISACGVYRYLLVRDWDATRSRIVFVMLNPSTADALQDDPTVRRCIGFAQALGHGSLSVVNLFAYRATDPKALRAAGWPVGDENDEWIIRACSEADEVVCAWGANARGLARVDEALGMLSIWAKRAPKALALTSDGVPKHPLYLPASARPVKLIAQC